MIRVMLPQHLQVLASAPREVELEIKGPVTPRSIIDHLEAKFPGLTGTVCDHVTLKRRPMVRFFACEEDVSQSSPDDPLPPAVASGVEAFYIVGAIAGG